jgi:hypothetical protein
VRNLSLITRGDRSGSDLTGDRQRSWHALAVIPSSSMSEVMRTALSPNSLATLRRVQRRSRLPSSSCLRGCASPKPWPSSSGAALSKPRLELPLAISEPAGCHTRENQCSATVWMMWRIAPSRIAPEPIARCLTPMFPRAGPLTPAVARRRTPAPMPSRRARPSGASARVCHVGQVKGVLGLGTVPCEPSKPLKNA